MSANVFGLSRMSRLGGSSQTVRAYVSDGVTMTRGVHHLPLVSSPFQVKETTSSRLHVNKMHVYTVEFIK